MPAKRPSSLAIFTILAALALLAGCGQGPDQKKPEEKAAAPKAEAPAPASAPAKKIGRAHV